MAVDDATIQAWLQQNAGASDADIRAAMDQYGVDTSQMARATGMDYATMQGRYEAAGGTPAPAPNGLLTQPQPQQGYTDDQVRSWIGQYYDPAKGDWSVQGDATNRLASDMQRFGVGFDQMGRVLGISAYGGMGTDSVENLYAHGYYGVYNRNTPSNLGTQTGAERENWIRQGFDEVKGNAHAAKKWMMDNNVAYDEIGRLYGQRGQDVAQWANGMSSGLGNSAGWYGINDNPADSKFRSSDPNGGTYWSGGFDDHMGKLKKLSTGVDNPNSKFATGGSAPRGTTPGTGGVTPLPGATSPGGPGGPGGPTTPGGGVIPPLPNGPNWTVDDPQTVEGRLNNLLVTDDSGTYTNPVIRQAVDRALQAFNGRGLLNSSMAQQAAQEAAISKATEIAKSDAETYAAAAKQNAQNAWQGGENNTNRQWQSGENNANRNLDWQKAWMNADTALKQSNISKGTQVEIAEMNRKYAQQANNSQAVSSLLQQYNSSVTRITESDLTVEAKEAALKQYKQVFMSGVKLIGSINGDTSFEELLNSLFPNG